VRGKEGKGREGFLTLPIENFWLRHWMRALRQAGNRPLFGTAVQFGYIWIEVESEQAGGECV